jgi:acetolactate decarboxylase
LRIPIDRNVSAPENAQRASSDQTIPSGLVGFRMPAFVKGINVPGYHVHFLTADRKAGGHVVEFTLEGGRLEVAMCSRIDLLLPADANALKDIDFSRDRAQELEKVEK